MADPTGRPAAGLRRVRRGARLALALGVAASLAANVLHADPDPVSRLISAWPPVALIVTVELISRVPAASRRLSAVRVAATAAVAGIAAWVSYWHMAAVAARYGETPSAAHMIPLSVDGMIVVASVCLLELGRHVRAAESAPATAPAVPARAGHDPVLDALLPAAFDVARRIGNGAPPSGRALAQALRAEGHKVASYRVRPLADAVAARWPVEVAGVAR
jgi:hypothetical protein